ncbi:MAG: iron ABC transporter permease, partial [Clostridiales bacterium]|nr:iron ABC transporter permease [Clostridiales bacterium]
MKKTGIKLTLAAMICIAVLIIASGTGSVSIGVGNMIGILGNRLFGIAMPEGLNPILVSILWNIRIPRALAAFLAGSALAVSGTVMQSVLRNPLASSYTLGVSSGASLGAAIVIVYGLTIPVIGIFTLPLAGFVSGLVTVFLAMGFSLRLDRNMENNTIILVGMVLSLFVNALLTLVISLSREHLQQLVFWQMGSFSSIGWEKTAILAAVTVFGIVFLMFYVQEMDIMTFGEEQALSLGLDLKKIKFILIAVSALITGTAVAFTGIIGFVDLIAPHIVRKIFGST